MFTPLTDADYAEALRGIDSGVLIFHKKLCPHCKNMEKVLEKCAPRMAGVRFFLMDSEVAVEAMREMGTERIPLIAIIKGGQVKTTKAGLMNPKELMALYEQA